MGHVFFVYILFVVWLVFGGKLREKALRARLERERDINNPIPDVRLTPGVPLYPGEEEARSIAREAQPSRNEAAIAIVIGLIALFWMTFALAAPLPQPAFAGSTVQHDAPTTRFYDSRGNSLGSASTYGNTTKFYDARGNLTGSATMKGGQR
jgi:hypothetical protein